MQRQDEANRMTFIHDDPDFEALLQIVANDRRLNIALVEKDYWVTHTLWALHAQGFEVWFKGRHLPVEGLRPHRAVLRGPRPEDRARGGRRRT